MAGKWAWTAVAAYLLFLAGIYLYLFSGPASAIPDEWKGTEADPAVFLSKEQLRLTGEYSQIRDFVYFAVRAFEWLMYSLILLTGLSKGMEKLSVSQTRFKAGQAAVYLFWLSLVTFIVLLPISWAGYKLSKSYHISTQSFHSWMKDEWISFWVDYGMYLLIVPILYWLIRKNGKKWWLYAWGLSVPFVILLMYIQPVVIDPLYNDFYPLKNKQLETEILDLAESAGIPAGHVYEVNMAYKTNALNAYVTGIGSNARIVLWDTALNRLEDPEILFIMAHEMAHYVQKHIYIGIAGYLAMLLAGLWLIAKLMDWIISKWGDILKVESAGSLSSFPLFLLLAAFLLFASSPLTNYVSRWQETRADRYAIELTGDHKAAVSAFQELTRSGLSDVNPPLLVKWFRYSHPPMFERIVKAEEKLGEETGTE